MAHSEFYTLDTLDQWEVELYYLSNKKEWFNQWQVEPFNQLKVELKKGEIFDQWKVELLYIRTIQPMRIRVLYRSTI